MTALWSGEPITGIWEQPERNAVIRINAMNSGKTTRATLSPQAASCTDTDVSRSVVRDAELQIYTK
jgi:hypothetical protein